jgi:hypothetical protein
LPESLFAGGAKLQTFDCSDRGKAFPSKNIGSLDWGGGVVICALFHCLRLSHDYWYELTSHAKGTRWATRLRFPPASGRSDSEYLSFRTRISSTKGPLTAFFCGNGVDRLGTFSIFSGMAVLLLESGWRALNRGIFPPVQDERCMRSFSIKPHEFFLIFESIHRQPR